ncbi:MFS transporter [Xanthomonas cerealis]|uniref:MFS transporter n=2 Tax=Xanthomonas cerealis TaxID=3390025 RepID=UPI0009B7F107|nr:MFS transporter [Xanthomonas translucens]UKE47457.1 MFS transporter [Xanthomonas translucens pv. cerealis]
MSYSAYLGQRRVLTFVLWAALSVGACEMLVVVLLLRALQRDSSGLSAALVYVASTGGFCLMGLMGQRILHHVSPRVIGLGGGLLCTAIATAASLQTGMYFDYFVISCISFITALDYPNINSCVTYSTPANLRGVIYSNISIGTGVMLVTAPVVGAVLVSEFGSEITIQIIAFVFAASCLSWVFTPLSRDWKKSKKPSGIFQAYKLILDGKGLRTLTINRILNGFIYVGVPVSIPFMISNAGVDGRSYGWLQSASIFAIRFGGLSASLTLSYLLKKNPGISGLLGVACTYLGFLAVIILLIFSDYRALLGACFLVGIGNAFFRTVGLVLGPAVTAPDVLPQVILAGDSLVRFSYFAYTGILTALAATWITAPGALLLFSISALPAPHLLKTALRAYAKQLGTDERRE